MSTIKHPKSFKVTIFGRGYMAHRIETHLREAGRDARIDPVDVTNTAALEQVFKVEKPDIVINAAGKTVIDEIEQHQNQPTAFLVNVGGPANIAYYAAKHGTYCIQLSSGCIFDGEGKDGQGFREDDIPNPGCYYGWTKAWGDWQLYPFLKHNRILIVRLRMPLSRYSHPRNLLDKLGRYGAVIDSQNSITVVEDFLPAFLRLIDQTATGIYHMTNPGTMSPYEIVGMMQHYHVVPRDKVVKEITKAELDTMTTASGRARRVNTVLNTDKLQSRGITMTPIRDAVEQAIQQFARSPKEII